MSIDQLTQTLDLSSGGLKAENPGWLDEAVVPAEAGKIVGRSEKALGILRVRGGGPPYVKCGRSVRYIRRDLFEWLQAHRVKSTSQSSTGQSPAKASLSITDSR